MKKIIWLRDGLEIPGVGVTRTGKSANVEKVKADDLIRQGIATDGRLSKKEKEILKGDE